MSNGKGSRPRPMQISREEYARRFDEAFGKKDLDKFQRRLRARKKIKRTRGTNES